MALRLEMSDRFVPLRATHDISSSWLDEFARSNIVIGQISKRNMRLQNFTGKIYEYQMHATTDRTTEPRFIGRRDSVIRPWKKAKQGTVERNDSRLLGRYPSLRKLSSSMLERILEEGGE